MKARVKATGEIVEVYLYGKEGYDYVCNDKEEVYERSELEILDDPDYWTRLEHQAAIAAMGGMCGNKKYNDYAWDDMAKFAIKAAHTLVEKMKNGV